jgi:predicted acetyltransferase
VSCSPPCSNDPGTSSRTEPTRPPVVLEPIAKDQVPVLGNLFELYAHDFSEHMPLDLKSNGRFDVGLDDRWWTRDDHFPFFIRWNEKLSGFALVRRGSRVTGASDVMDVAEFFVVRGARGKAVGTSAAHALFTAFPGRWEIRVRRTNVSAMRFWSRALETWIGRPAASEPFSAEGVDWDALRVESSPK